MTCTELQAALTDYIDGTLDPRRKAAVERHLAECASCAELARDASLGAAFLKQAPGVQPPDELLTRILFHVPRSGARDRRPGLRGWLHRWAQPVLAPRFAMGMAMTILSFSLIGRFLGAPDHPLRPADVKPARIVETVEDQVHRLWDHAVGYYESLRVVYEIQNRLDEWKEEDDGSAPATPAGPDTSRQAQPGAAHPAPR